jgi:hypothetical protein
MPNDLREICDVFSLAVDNKAYSKIDYCEWKLLKKAWNCDNTIAIEYYFDSGEVCLSYTDKQGFISDESEDFIWCGYSDDKSFGSYLFNRIESIETLFDIYNTKPIYTNKNTNINKENENMKSFANFGDFGPVNSNMVRMSMYGMAVKNKSDVYVSYNTKTGEIFDVDIFNFNASNFLYKIPVAIKDIEVGDVVIHNRAPMFVVAINGTHKTLEVVDPINGERKEIILTKSPFGFDFATKVVNFIEGAFNSTPSNDNPFGNMWMYMMLGDNDTDMSKIMPLVMMANGGFDTSNPASAMMMMACMGNGKSSSMNDMMPLIAMSMMNTNACKCGGGCSCGEGKTE